MTSSKTLKKKMPSYIPNIVVNTVFVIVFSIAINWKKFDLTYHSESFHDSTSLKSNSYSLFNCELNQKCVYYYPNVFFQTSGHSFRYLNTDITNMKKNGTLWRFMPTIGFHTITLGEHIQLSAKPMEDPFLHERVSFLHVHKSAGTTIQLCFKTLQDKYKVTLVKHRVFSPVRRHPPGLEDEKRPTSRKLYSKDVESARNVLRAATTYPRKFSQDDHVIFAVVRDPTERFISSVGQAMGAKGSSSSHAKKFQKACIKRSSKETLRCCINYIKKNNFWFDLHFTPQTVEISFSTMFLDVPIAIFHFQEIPSILHYFRLPPTTRTREGSKPNYRPKEVLTRMSVKDYDDDMIRDVCEIYKVDVIMQRSLGFKVTSCDPFIPA